MSAGDDGDDHVMSKLLQAIFQALARNVLQLSPANLRDSGLRNASTLLDLPLAEPKLLDGLGDDDREFGLGGK
jgi:hypothetical protein